MAEDKKTRSNEIRQLATQLLDDLENPEIKVTSILMRARRLARLTKDEAAQKWLDLETCGYPEKFNFSEIGNCKKYAFSSKRIWNVEEEGKKFSRYRPTSLPEIEANAIANEEVIRQSQFSMPSATAKDFVEKNATEALRKSQLQIQNQQKKAYVESQGLLATMRAGLHNYATETYIAIELGHVAQDIFEAARVDIDKFVRAHCPAAAKKIVAINDRMKDETEESYSSALTSCRRLLMSIADSLYPASDGEWEDRKGKKRKVGTEQYKNRILAYLSGKTIGDGDWAILSADIELIAAKLDAVYEKACKGVHSDVTMQEARLGVIHTYLFVGQIARYHEEPHV